MNELDYLDRYEFKLQGRYPTIRMALNIFHQKNMEMIVETGCMRGFLDWGAGMSTYIFAEYASKFNKYFHSVDLSEQAVNVARYAISELSAGEVHQGDSIKFLQDWQKGAIHLLYLDSMDMSDDPELAKQSAHHQLNEIEVAWDKLADNAIILLDDTGFIGAGKDKLSRHFLKERGAVELYHAQQSLWMRI